MNETDPFVDNIAAEDPFPLLKTWFDEARETEDINPEAAQLATVDATGMPNIRTVLIKDVRPEFLSFFTNFNSQKGIELQRDNRAALLFYWRNAGRQIRLRGTCAPVDDIWADRYFSSRPFESQIGAHASKQSEALPDRAQLATAVEALKSRFEKRPVPRPAHWSGFRLTPVAIEFWQAGEFRLHDRLLFEKIGSRWRISRLYP